MKLLFIALNLIALSANAQSMDKSERMNQLLIDSDVRSWGPRQHRDANILCRIPKKTQKLNCHVKSGAFSDGSYLEDVEYQGAKAKEISDLLIEFEALPSGRRQRQDLEIVCKFKKGTQIINCKSTDYVELWI